MGKHSTSGRGNASQGDGKHHAGKLSREETTIPAAQRAQLDRQGGFDVGGHSSTRSQQRGSDTGQSHQRD
jgi:hypothetical protein